MPASLRIACSILVLATLTRTQEGKALTPEPLVLEGRVVDLRGNGVPAAKGWIATPEAVDAALAKTTADGDGYFRMKAPLQRNLQVHATGEGTCRGAVPLGTGAVTIAVHDAATVCGVLRNRAGQPLKDVAVRAYPTGRVLYQSHATARTNAEGRFELLRVALGPTRIVAWVDGEGLAEVAQRIGGNCEIALAPLDVATTSLRVEVE